MTDKQGRILEAALELFASKGYASTSTSGIAKLAKVSEGLIFRHYENKEALLKDILVKGYESIQPKLYSILMETDPEVIIDRVIGLPLELLENKSNDWRLIFSIKFQNLNLYRSINDDSMLLDPLFEKLEGALLKLGFEDPARESRLLFFVMEGISSHSIKNGSDEATQMLNFIKSKYIKKSI